MNILLIGAFPPPTHGMAAINQALVERMIAKDWNVKKMDTMPPDMRVSFLSRLSRLTVLLPFWISIITLKNPSIYIAYLALSAGWGQVYDVVTVILCKILGIKCVFHHHSVAYLIKKKVTTSLLIDISGKNALHVVLCEYMKENLKQIYGCSNVLLLSNVALAPLTNQLNERTGLKTIGFISNISREKGGWDFIKLAKTIHEKGWPITCKVAGPCYDRILSQALQKAHKQGLIEWVGPVYNAKKIAFWNSIDLFVFPTQNEAEPLVVWEALASGVPVIAYKRGCIAAQLEQSGELIAVDSNFVDSTINIINLWINSPDIYKGYVKNTIERRKDAHKNAEKQWGEFVFALEYEITKK